MLTDTRRHHRNSAISIVLKKYSRIFKEVFIQVADAKFESRSQLRLIERDSGPGEGISQLETSIQVAWSLSANQRPVSRSRDVSESVRGQYPGHVINKEEGDVLVFYPGKTSGVNGRDILISSSSSHNTQPGWHKFQLSEYYFQAGAGRIHCQAPDSYFRLSIETQK